MKKNFFVTLLVVSLIAVMSFTGCVMTETEVGEAEKKAEEFLGNSWRTESHNFEEVSRGQWITQVFKVFMHQTTGDERESFKLGEIDFNQIQDISSISEGDRGLYSSCKVRIGVRDVVGDGIGSLLASCETDIPTNCETDVCIDPKPKWYGCQPKDGNGNLIDISTDRSYFFEIKYKNPKCIYNLIHHVGGDGLPDTEARGSSNEVSWDNIGENEEYVRVWAWDDVTNTLGNTMYSHDSIFENGGFEKGTLVSWSKNPSYNLGKIDVVEIMTGSELRLEWDKENGCKIIGNSLDLSAYTSTTKDGTDTLIALSDYLNKKNHDAWIKFVIGTSKLLIDCTIPSGSDVFFDETKIKRDGKQQQLGTTDFIVTPSVVKLIAGTWTFTIAKKINANVKEGKYALKLLRDVSYAKDEQQRIQIEQDEEINDEYDYYLDAWTYADTNMEEGSAMGLVLTTGTTQSQTWQNNDAVYLLTYGSEDMAKELCDTYLNFVCINRLGTSEGEIGTALITEDGIELTKDTGYIKGKWIHVDDMPLNDLFNLTITYQPFHFSFCFGDIPCSPAPPPVTILTGGLKDTLRVKPAMGTPDDHTTEGKYNAAFFDDIKICAVPKGTKPTGDICGN